MKSIELTEEHKTKLLEMCKILFSEYNNIRFGIPPFGTRDIIQFYKGSKTSPNYPFLELSIHWFEFCMTHLANKLLLSTGSNNNIFIENTFNKISLFRGIIFDEDKNQNEHPIDYLYEEFKKLK